MRWGHVMKLIPVTYAGRYGQGRNSLTAPVHPLIEHGVILGDAAFGLHPFLISPFKEGQGRRLSQEQETFNYRHSSARLVVEQAIGLLKNKWAVLQHGKLRCSMEHTPMVIDACFALHNFLLAEEGVDYVPDDDTLDMLAERYREEEVAVMQPEQIATPYPSARAYYKAAVDKRQDLMRHVLENPQVGHQMKRYKLFVFNPDILA